MAKTGHKQAKTPLESGDSPNYAKNRPKMIQKRPTVSQIVQNSPIWSKLVRKHKNEVLVEQPRLHLTRCSRGCFTNTSFLCFLTNLDHIGLLLTIWDSIGRFWVIGSLAGLCRFLAYFGLSPLSSGDLACL